MLGHSSVYVYITSVCNAATHQPFPPLFSAPTHFVPSWSDSYALSCGSPPAPYAPAPLTFFLSSIVLRCLFVRVHGSRHLLHPIFTFSTVLLSDCKRAQPTLLPALLFEVPTHLRPTALTSTATDQGSVVPLLCVCIKPFDLFLIPFQQQALPVSNRPCVSFVLLATN